jgi:hypothetical protein
MTESPSPYAVDHVILTVRDQKVIFDSDLARIYGVPTKALNQAVRRNRERFPDDFMFQVTREEAEASRSRSQTVTLKRGQNVKYLPYAFTEHGAIIGQRGQGWTLDSQDCEGGA